MTHAILIIGRKRRIQRNAETTVQSMSAAITGPKVIIAGGPMKGAWEIPQTIIGPNVSSNSRRMADRRPNTRSKYRVVREKDSLTAS